MYLGTILLTGATGSFGQEFTRQALKYGVKALRLYSRNEYLQWQMKQRFQDDRLRWMVGDIRDRDRLSACMRGVDSVVHAAALKHVSIGQYNPQEFIKTNVMGSVNVVDSAAEMGVKNVLGISSDKAVAPSCLYGSTKQIMEWVFLDANRWSSPATKFSILRSGNFVESHGNVFETWAEQAKSGEITLSSPDMKRYFIPIEHVVKFALDILGMMQGNEIFVPKMREMSMLELCKNTYPDAKIKITGKGEGEKEREELFTQDEKPIDCTDYWRIAR